MFKKYYKWTLKEDYVLDLNTKFNGKYHFLDFKSKFVIVKDNILTIKSGYSWDGCSPKFKIFNVVLGVWDGPVDKTTGKQMAYYPTVVHDALYQFNLGKRKNADNIFNALFKKFILHEVYYLAVRLFGKSHWKK